MTLSIKLVFLFVCFFCIHGWAQAVWISNTPSGSFYISSDLQRELPPLLPSPAHFSCCSWLQSAVLKLLHFDPICLIHGKCIRFECCMEDLTCLTVTSWCLSALKTTKIRKKTQTLDFLLTTLFVQCLALRTSASLVTKWLKFSDPQGFFCTCLPSGIYIVSVTNVH